MKEVIYWKHKIFEKRFLALLFISLFISVLALAVTYLASWYIHETFQQPPVVRDLIWEKLPYLNVLWLSEIFLMLSIVFMICWAFKNNKYLLPYAIILYSIFHFLRAGLIVLTPLGFPYEYTGIMHRGAESVFMYGAFPSGHLSIPYLTFMVTKNKIALAFTFLVGLFLLLSRGHYSIDLIGTLLLAYPLFKFSEKYLKRYFVK